MNDTDSAVFEAEGHLFYDILPTGNIADTPDARSPYSSREKLLIKLLLINLLVYYGIHINACKRGRLHQQNQNS